MYLPYGIRRLGADYDPERLRDEVDGIPEQWWLRHTFDGTRHDVVPLISHRGLITLPDGSDNHSLERPFLDTPYLDQLPYIREVVHSFGVQASRSRLMRIDDGAALSAHQDRHPHWNDKVRLHIPVITNPLVSFHVWRDDPDMPDEHHQQVHMRPGETWVFNTWFFHSVINQSDTSRVHLVIDLPVEGAVADLVYDGCTEEEVAFSGNFVYDEYAPPDEVRRWATARVSDETAATG